MKNIQEILPLYFVAGTQDCRHLGDNPAENLLFVLKQALEGGITCFQFRDKGKFSLENSPTEQRSAQVEALGVEIRRDRIAEDERIVVGDLKRRVPAPGILLAVVVGDASGADHLVEPLLSGDSDSEGVDLRGFVHIVQVAPADVVIRMEVEQVPDGREPQRRGVVAPGIEVSGALYFLVDGKLRLLLGTKRSAAEEQQCAQCGTRVSFHRKKCVRCGVVKPKRRFSTAPFRS